MSADGEEDDRGQRSRPRARGRRPPSQDLGPASRAEKTGREALRPSLAWSAADEFTIEAVEIAGVLAEQAVTPFLAGRGEPRFRGWSFVVLRFHDAWTLASFRRTRSVKASEKGSWCLVRRWATADGDGGLDEAMCGAVARCLNDDFSALLTAEVITWIERA